jgi:hypothetical protein
MSSKKAHAPLAPLTSATAFTLFSSASGERSVRGEVEAPISGKETECRFPAWSARRIGKAVCDSQRFVGDTRPPGIGHGGHIVNVAPPEFLKKHKVGIFPQGNLKSRCLTAVSIDIGMDVRGEQSH